MVQENMNEAMVQSALQVIPAVTTMVDSLGKAWKNFPDMSNMLSNVAARVSDVGISAKNSAFGVAGFMGGFLAADTILGAIPDNMRAIAGALTATIAAIVAATVAWMAFHGTMTVGIAVPVILAAVGVGVAGVKAAVGMAQGAVVTKPTHALVGEGGEAEVVLPVSKFVEVVSETSGGRIGSVTELFESPVLAGIPRLANGGVVTEPTLAWIGEAGPERVEPLDRFSSRGTQYNTLYVNVTIGNITKEYTLEQVEETVIDGIVKAVDRMS